LSLLVALGVVFLGVLPIALVANLARIADALEAQNQLHESWCESQETPFS
jgi:hypothetical protein